MRSTEDVHTPLACSIASVATNTVLNYILIYGKLGFPALKLRGAAIATAIAMVVQAVLLFVIGNAKKNIIHAPIGDFFKKDIEFFKKFLRVCAPIMLNELLWEWAPMSMPWFMRVRAAKTTPHIRYSAR